MAEETQTLDKDKILSCPSRRILFDGIMRGLTQKEAAKKAGITHDTARKYCTKGHINALVKQEQAKIQAKTAKKLEITAERVLAEYARIAFVDPAEMYDKKGKLKLLHKMPEDVRRAISTLEKGNKGRKARTWSKTEALDALGRHLGIHAEDNAQKRQHLQVAVVYYTQAPALAEQNLSENRQGYK
jgi:phage terminase small subunit